MIYEEIHIPLVEGRALMKGKAKVRPGRDRYGRKKSSLSAIRPPRNGWIMTPEMRSWMLKNVGTCAPSIRGFHMGKGDYQYLDQLWVGKMVFWIRDPEAAMLFKLTSA